MAEARPPGDRCRQLAAPRERAVVHGAHHEVDMGRAMGEELEHVRLAVRHHRDPRRAAELPGPPRGRQPADALAVLEGPAQAARPATFGTLQKLRVERAEDAPLAASTAIIACR